MNRLLFLCSLIIGLVNSAWAAPVITEFMAGNGSTLADGDGNFPDWIEVHNPDDAALDLAGYSLTDGDGVWTFPAGVELAAGGYLIVFASQATEPDYRDAADGLHGTFALALGGEPVHLLAPGGSEIVSGYEIVPPQRQDISYGVDPASGEAVFFNVPTPGTANGKSVAGFVEPVAFSVAHGFKDAAFELTLSTTTPGAEIFYSLDGSNPGALKVSETLIDSIVVAEAAARTAYVPTGADDPRLRADGKAWPDLDFVEPEGWVSGAGPIGFDSTLIPGEYTDLIGFDLGEQMRSNSASALVRIPFQLSDTEAAETDFLTLSVKYDDGFVAYINGVKVAEANAPTELNGASTATTSHRDSDAIKFEDFDAAGGIAGLRAGRNVLAIHTLNATVTGSDVFNSVQLTAARYESVAISGVSFTEPLQVDGTTTVRAFASKEGFAQSSIGTQSYLFAESVLEQPAAPEGFPSTWGEYTGTNNSSRGAPVPADYEMNPAIVNDDRAAMIAALKALPSMSIVMDPDDLFSNEGILPNPFAGVDGRTGVFTVKPFVRDRHCSVEWIDPNGGPEIQIDCGIRVSGGWSRHYIATPKKSFSLLFKEQFGPSKLRFKVFPDSELDAFDRLILKAIFSNAWPDAARPPEYLRDHFLRKTHTDMGRESSHGTWVHLYLNGLYWGLYNPTERPDASYAASHYGGTKEDYDAIKHASVPGPGNAPTNRHEVIDGDNVAWRAAVAVARDGLDDPENYAAFKRYIDVGNLADYIILNTYTANVDWPHKNWYANRRRVEGAGFTFYPWDGEYALQDTGVNLTGVNNPDTPAYFYAQARRNPEFQVLFADRVHRYLFNGGALTPEVNQARYSALAEIIEPAITAEAARWGDNGGTRQGRTNFTKRNWENARDGVLNFFDRRHNTALSHYRSAKLYPDVEAPVFNQHGGTVDAGFMLTMTSPDSAGGQILYTTDGSDPRVPQTGEAQPETLLITETAAVQVRVPTSANEGFEVGGSNWADATFVPDGSWLSGTAPVGFEGSPGGFNDLVNINIEDAMRGVSASVLLRFPFDLSQAALNEFNVLKLRMKYDDGFVAFINGVEVAQMNAPANRDSTAPATTSHRDSDAVVFEEFDVSAGIGGLRAGGNVLAIQGFNTNITGSDFLIAPELAAASDQRISPASSVYSGPVALDSSANVRARLLKGEDWSALDEAYFQVGATAANADNVVISRIHYRPAVPSAAEAAMGFNSRSDFEYLAILNRSDARVTLDHLQFTEGIAFDFTPGPANDLAPGEQAFVVSNADAFAMRYGTTGARVVGTFANKLSDSGEMLQLLAADGTVIAKFAYDDAAPWPEAADGAGFALALVAPGSRPDLADGSNWRAVNSVPVQIHGDAFAAWMAANGFSDQNADDTGTGVSNFVAYALGYDLDFNPPEVASVLPTSAFRFQMRSDADDITVGVEQSSDLATWSAISLQTAAAIENGDGTRTLAVPFEADILRGSVYFRLRISPKAQ